MNIQIYAVHHVPCDPNLYKVYFVALFVAEPLACLCHLGFIQALTSYSMIFWDILRSFLRSHYNILFLSGVTIAKIPSDLIITKKRKDIKEKLCGRLGHPERSFCSLSVGG